MPRSCAKGLGIMLIAALGACSHPAYGPSSDSRLETAVKESGTANGSEAPSTMDDVMAHKCSGYHEKLAKAHNEELKEEDQLDAYMSLYKELKGKNDFIDEALAKNPDLQYQNDGAISKVKDECVQALADVRSDYFALIVNISDPLVVQDVHGRPVARLDLKKFKAAVVLLDPDDKDSLLQRIDAADRKVKSSGN